MQNIMTLNNKNDLQNWACSSKPSGRRPARISIFLNGSLCFTLLLVLPENLLFEISLIESGLSSTDVPFALHAVR